MSEQKEKLKALQLTIDKLEKTYGKGAVMKLSDEKVLEDYKAGGAKVVGGLDNRS